MTEKEKAFAGILYDATYDEEIVKGRLQSQEQSNDYNQFRPSQKAEREAMVRRLFKKTGKNFVIEQPFQCDFWERVSIGENFYSNYNLIILAGTEVEFGDNVFIAPNCGIYAAGHPLSLIHI